MNKIYAYALLSWALFSIPNLAADKENVVAETKKEADILKELEKFNAAELTFLKAGFAQKHNRKKSSHDFVFLNHFSADDKKMCLSSNIGASSTEEVAKELKAYLDTLWRWRKSILSEISFESNSTKCKRQVMGWDRYGCQTFLSYELYKLLDQKLKENQNFLDEKITNKKNK